MRANMTVRVSRGIRVEDAFLDFEDVPYLIAVNVPIHLKELPQSDSDNSVHATGRIDPFDIRIDDLLYDQQGTSVYKVVKVSQLPLVGKKLTLDLVQVPASV